MGHVEQPNEILANITYKSPREASLRFVDAVRYYHDQLDGNEELIAQEARSSLSLLTDHQGEETIYHEYAVRDILEGLSEIDHSSCQLIIAEMLPFVDEHTQTKITNLLSKEGAHIHPETLSHLLGASDLKSNELALSILEKNATAGHEHGSVHPEVKAMLLTFMSENADGQTQRRVAVITSHLHKRMEEALAEHPKNSDLFEKGQMVLEAYIGGIVEHYSNQDTLNQAIAGTVKAGTNHMKAHNFVMESVHPTSHQKPQVPYQTAIRDMAITLPETIPGGNETKALTELLGQEGVAGSEPLTNYNDVMSFIRHASRQVLLSTMTEEFEKQRELLRLEKVRELENQRKKAKETKDVHDANESKEKVQRQKLESEAEDDKTRGEAAQKKFNLQIPQ